MPLAPAIAVVVLLGLATVVQGGGARAQDSAPNSGQHPIVGSWQVNNTITGAMDQEVVLSTFAADGVLLVSVKPVSPAPPDAPFTHTYASLMHGNWTALEPNEVAFTMIRLQTDESGAYLGTVTVSAVVDVSSDGQRVSGQFTYEVADPAGNVVASGHGTSEGVRIEIEAMGTPGAATPST